MIHETAVVEEGADLGPGTEVCQFTVVRAGAVVGARTRICSHAYIDRGVQIGTDCKIKNGALLYQGLVVEDGVFIGPGVCFTNDNRPDARNRMGPPYPKTLVCDGASIGANATLLPGITIGPGALIGAGAVVTDSVAPGATIVGDPARDI